MARGGVTILGAWLAHHQLGFEGFRERLEAAGARAGQPVSVSERTFYRWLNGQVERPNRAQAAALEEVTGLPAEVALGPVSERAAGPEQEAADFLIEVNRDGLTAAYNRRVSRGYVGLEQRATAIYTFDLAVIPGLLQTHDYALAIFRAERPPLPAPVRRALADARVERQVILERPEPPQLWSIIGEAALRSRVGGWPTMAGQLERLAEVFALPHVEIQVLPTETDAHTSMGSGFRILRLPSDPPMVFTETSLDGMHLGAGEDVESFSQRWHELREIALGRAESLACIREIAATIREEHVAHDPR